MALARYVMMSALLGSAVAGPAAAEDCFIKVRPAAAAPAPKPKAATPARAVKLSAAQRPTQQAHKPVVRKVRVATAPAKPAAPMKKLPESSYAMRTAYLPAAPSTECDTKPSIQAALPPEARPPAQRLLDEIAGPPVEIADASPPAGIGGIPVGGGPGGGIPIGWRNGGGGGGGGGFVAPPGEEKPTTPGGGEPPVVNPPGEGEPPVVNPPGGGEPPIVIPPGPTDPDPPIVKPPGPGDPKPPIDPGPISPIPEPGVWMTMIIGFFGLGTMVRRSRAAERRRVNA